MGNVQNTKWIQEEGYCVREEEIFIQPASRRTIPSPNRAGAAFKAEWRRNIPPMMQGCALSPPTNAIREPDTKDESLQASYDSDLKHTKKGS
ncbi:hypothetical protein HYFRA_00002729 [Hymenoscyphus fraxineus]|uniref:Uncharacterized protein n=1 Tax=Hymenoscyphus fraxineus TaxID=746836 RepID=A0A9N9L9V5_9HELO|nr:hypothetical protein HYFRA_00005689 [Hymenoscyphus fraxineus]CAG8961186.1 hypothetical protein HYFRA_00002729 [Hymenoscyphus fraxineus]